MKLLPLYHHPAIYRLAFPMEEEMAPFFAGVAGDGVLLDLGCCDGQLGVAWEVLTGGNAIGVDLIPSVFGGGRVVRGDVLALPLMDGAANAVVSVRFGVSYAVARESAPDTKKALARMKAELVRVLRPGGILAIELPVAYQPHKLAGLPERSALPSGSGWSEIQYLDILCETGFGTVLDSRMEVETGAGSDRCLYTMQAPMHVFTPIGVRQWLGDEFGDVRFYAPYDASTQCAAPPDEVMRAVVVALRK